MRSHLCPGSFEMPAAQFPLELLDLRRQKK